MQNQAFQPLTVLYDGACPLCRREIAHAKGLADTKGGSALCFIDISADENCDPRHAQDRAQLLARFHVERADGSRVDGAAAFVEMWERLPGWRWLARIAKLPGALVVFELAYLGFLHLRPALQAVARQFEPRPAVLTADDLKAHMVRELRSDHAGELGAVCIYSGIAAVAKWRGNAQLLEFASRHLATEAEHLRLIEEWIEPAARSKLLGPWRLAGWLTGALPALFSNRAVYATIAAVETFVDHHYQEQIDTLEAHCAHKTSEFTPESERLLALLKRCQADEIHHRDESNTLAGNQKSMSLALWCSLIGAGSKIAVALARRI
jgi:3-demethoxyubiquinol 3-hydroxylase